MEDLDAPSNLFLYLLDFLRALQGTRTRMRLASVEGQRFWEAQRKSIHAAASSLNIFSTMRDVRERMDRIVDLDRAPESTESLVAARCLAWVIAEHLDNRIPGEISRYFARRSNDPSAVDHDTGAFLGHVPLLPGDPLPLTPYEQLFRVDRDRRGQRRKVTRFALPFEQEPHRIPGMTLMPTIDGDVECSIDYSLSQLRLYSSSRLATGHPVAGRKTFVRNDPRHGEYGDPPEAAARMRMVLTAAGEQGAAMLVLPEGTFTPAVEQDLLEAWAALPATSRPRVLVPGSRYEREGDDLLNWAPVYGYDDTTRVRRGTDHHKIEPVRRAKPPLFSADREPLAGRPPQLALHVLSAGTTLAVLICRDVLSPSLARAVEDLEIDFVAVPALSPDCLAFAASIANWSVSRQISTVLANLWSAESTHSIVGRPSLGVGSAVAEGTDCVHPGLHVVDVTGGKWQEA